MGLLRLVGSLKLWVIFVEYRLFYRALLQKRPTILRSLLTEATPYAYCEYSYYSPFSRKQERERERAKERKRERERTIARKTEIVCARDKESVLVYERESETKRES